MVNGTIPTDFYLMSFLNHSSYILLIASTFSFLYFFGVLTNSIIIALIYVDNQLHTPMYLFLCNLALIDICYTTTTVPKLLYMLLSGDNNVSFIQCFTQMYFYVLVSSTEDILIFIMAYDRYVAICNPLHYHTILSRKNCFLIATATWISGCLNSFVLTMPVSHMSFCHSRIIHQFFCDPKALTNISCAGRKAFYIVIFLEIVLLGFFPVMFSLTSYVKIMKVILNMKTQESRKKAFSTCSSHLIIILIYYTTGMSVFMMPPSEYSKVLEPVFAIMYSVVTPMINPLIYSLRNKEVKAALLRVLGRNKIFSNKGKFMNKLNKTTKKDLM